MKTNKLRDGNYQRKFFWSKITVGNHINYSLRRDEAWIDYLIRYPLYLDRKYVAQRLNQLRKILHESTIRTPLPDESAQSARQYEGII